MKESKVPVGIRAHSGDGVNDFNNSTVQMLKKMVVTYQLIISFKNQQ
jgi:hypothetical protein